MAFTFQINDGIEFNHNEELIDKADKNITPLHHETKMPLRIVELNDDKSKLDGVGVRHFKDITELGSLTFGRGEKVILDFGDHYVGHFSMKAKVIGSPMDAPLTFKIKFAELPTELKQSSNDYDGWLSKSWMQEEIVHLDELPSDINFTRRYSFRYVEISVIDTSPKWKVNFFDAKLITDSAVNTTNQIIPIKDEKLKKIYQVGLKTLADCMQDVFEDGPKRDRRLWIGDLRLQALADYASFKNLALIKRCMYLFGAMTSKDGRIPANVFVRPKYVPDDTFLLDYSLFFISILDDFMSHTNDHIVLDDLFPIAKKQIDYVLENMINSDGSVNFREDYPVFIDWSNDFDKNTAGIAVIIYTLKQFLHLLDSQNKVQVNRHIYEDKLLVLIKYAKSELFDEKKGLFISGENREFNIASQVWMVLAGVLSEEDNLCLMKTTYDKLFPVEGIATPYMYHHITEALFKVGLDEMAIKMLKDYWGKMIDLGADTYWEAFEPENPSYSPYGSSMVNSYCHAWSCTPVYLIDKYLKNKI